MHVEELRIYQLAMELGEDVWKSVNQWVAFNRDTISKPMVRSADSVAAIISEGFGRLHFKDAKNFNYYSRGSLIRNQNLAYKSAQPKPDFR